MMTVDDRTRPAFACDKCGQPIQPEKGLLLWDPEDEGNTVQNTILVCHRCDSGAQFFSQELDTGLIYLLICAGWLNQDWKPTAKLLTAAKKALALSCL